MREKEHRLTLKELREMAKYSKKVDQTPRTPLETAKTTLTNQQNNEYVERMCMFNESNSKAKAVFADKIKGLDDRQLIEPHYSDYLNETKPFKLSLKKDLDEMKTRHKSEAQILERNYTRIGRIVFPEWVNVRLRKEEEEVKKALELSKLSKANEEEEGN